MIEIAGLDTHIRRVLEAMKQRDDYIGSGWRKEANAIAAVANLELMDEALTSAEKSLVGWIIYNRAYLDYAPDWFDEDTDLNAVEANHQARMKVNAERDQTLGRKELER